MAINLCRCVGHGHHRAWAQCRVYAPPPPPPIPQSYLNTPHTVVHLGLTACSLDGTAKLWDVSTQRVMASIGSTERAPLLCCRVASSASATVASALAPPLDPKEVGTEGKVLVTGGDDGAVRLYDLRSREGIAPAWNLGSPVLSCMMLDETLVAAGTHDGHLGISDLRALREPLHVWQESGAPILAMQALSERRLVVGAGDGGAFVLHLGESHRPTILEYLHGFHVDPVRGVAVTSHASVVWLAGRDGIIRRYDMDEIRN